MLMPRKVKHRKQQRGRMSGDAKGGTHVSFGDFGIQALEPGWVPTRMGGPGAPDDMDQAHHTQTWLAASDDARLRLQAGHVRRRAGAAHRRARLAR